MKKANKEHLIWSNDIEETLGNFEEIKDQYREHLEINNYSPEEIEDALANENKNYQFAYDTTDMYLDDEKMNVSDDKGYYIILADIGRWNGRADGGKIILGLWRSIGLCFEEYNKVYIDGKRLKVEATHHDGTNIFQIKKLTKSIFQIKKLTKRGEQYWENHQYDMTDRELHQRLLNDSHYSHEVTQFKEVYGW